LVKQKFCENNFLAFLSEENDKKFIVRLAMNVDIIMHFPKETHEYEILEEQ